MTAFILALVFAALTLASVVLTKAYQRLPVKELKRRARQGDRLARALHRPAAYGVNMQLLLGIKTIVCAALSCVLFVVALPGWFAFLFIVFLLWLAFVWLPSTPISSFGVRLGVLYAPLAAWMLHYAHPLLAAISRFIQLPYVHSTTTDLYDSDDLIDLLEWQKAQPDNRITASQIDMAEHALTFGDKLVRDVYIPRSVVKVVSSSEAIGPILIDELHKTGHSEFLVYQTKKDNIIGTLRLHDVLAHAKKGGAVSSITKHDVHYIHEDFTLAQALQAFLKTKQHVFVVINSFEEFVGILTVDDILAQIIGQTFGDEFSEYENPRAVAKALAHKKHAEHEKANTEVQEVVE